jgi:transposase-like protein
VTAKLQQVDVLVAQGQGSVDATRQVGISESRYYRWRQEHGALKTDEVEKPEHQTSKASSEISAVRNNHHQTDLKAEAAEFEE